MGLVMPETDSLASLFSIGLWFFLYRFADTHERPKRSNQILQLAGGKHFQP